MMRAAREIEGQVSGHYDEEYFAWCSGIGRFGGWADVMKVRRFITAESDDLDLGCGCGFLLSALECRRKVGVEVNATTADWARRV